MEENTVEADANPPVNWLWRAVVLAAITFMVPSVAYTGLFEIFTGPHYGLPKYLAEFLGASVALFLSLLTLKVFNDKEALGLDIRHLFPVRPFRRTALVFLAGAAAEAVIITLYLLLALKYYRDYEGGAGIAKMWLGNDKWFFVFASTFLYATCEEIFLRGIVFTYIKKHAGFLTALLVSSLIFSLMHGGRLWLSLAMIFFDGVVFALAYEKTRSLAVPALLHGLHNSILRTILVLGVLE